MRSSGIILGAAGSSRSRNLAQENGCKFCSKPERVHASQPNDVAYEALVNVDECGHKVDFMGMPITLERMRWLRQHAK